MVSTKLCEKVFNLHNYKTKSCYIKKIITQTKTENDSFSIDPSKSIAYNSVVVDIASRLNTVEYDEALKYFTSIVLQNKSYNTLEKAIDHWSVFLSKHVDVGSWKKDVIPALEKAIMRSSELGYSILLFMVEQKAFSLAVDPENGWDLLIQSKIFGTNLFTAIKSTKESTKSLSKSVFISLLTNGLFSTSSLEKIINDVFKNLKLNLNADYKSFIGSLLNKLNIGYNVPVNTLLCEQLEKYLTKETNEHILSEFLCVYSKNLKYLPADDLNKHSNTVIKGLTEKKLPIKKIWVSYILSGYTKSNANTIDFQHFIDNSDIKNDLLEFCENQVLRSNSLTDHLLSAACLNIVVNCSSNMFSLSNEEKEFFGINICKVVASKMIDYKNIQDTFKEICNCYVSNLDLISDAILSGLSHIFKLTHMEATDDWKIIPEKLITAMKVISTQLPEDEYRSSKQLSKLSLFCKHPFVEKNLNKMNGWAGLCLLVNQDPFKVINDNSDFIIEVYNSILDDSKLEMTSDFYESIFKSFAYLTFINPVKMGSKVVDIINNGFDIDFNRLSEFDDESLEIFHSYKGDGKPVIDVILKNDIKKLEQMNKNSKDYESFKLDVEQRQKLKDQGKNFNKKTLTKDEQAKIDEQIIKEEKIFTDITFMRTEKIVPSLKLINALSAYVTLADTGMDQWFSVAIEKLLTLLKNDNYNLIFGEEPINVYFELAKSLPAQLEDHVKLFVAVATLRSLKIKNIPANLTEEPLLDLLSRVLYKIKFLTTRFPLNSTGLTFALPLLTYVLIEGKENAIKNSKLNHHAVSVGNSAEDYVSEDKEEEHLLLSLEIISTHAEQFQDETIPRKSILENLLSLLSLPSKSKISKEVFNTLCQNISITPLENDLKLICKHLLSSSPFVKSTILETLEEEFDLSQFFDIVPEVYVLLFDAEKQVSDLARQVWDSNQLNITPQIFDTLLSDDYFGLGDAGLRSFVGKAYASAVFLLASNSLDDASQGDIVSLAINKLILAFEDKSVALTDIVDKNGFVITPASKRKDPWEFRSTIAISLFELIDILLSLDKFDPKENIIDLIVFFTNSGCLGDINDLVRDEYKDAGVKLMTEMGKAYVEDIIPIFEDALTKEITALPAGKKATSPLDNGLIIQENIIVLYGSLAQHLDSDDHRIASIVSRLLDALTSPSENVHKAVSKIIAPLVPKFSDEVGQFISNLFVQLFDPIPPAFVRKGASWGLAGIISGYGIRSFLQFDIMRVLIDAAECKSNPIGRASVAFCIMTFSSVLGRLFEPYVIELLPYLLKNLGDQDVEVRKQYISAADTIMKHTTSYGLHKMIPVAISNLNEYSWRIKKGSVELLGSMAYLNPVQLSSSLSTIVPEIVGVLGDSHKEVRKSGDEALEKFGKVIRNPEVQTIVPVLLQAIGEPTKYTESALDALIKTQFVHYIDGPSLALIIHIIHRGMRERSANTKRLACKIVGNMAILVDSRDLIPYLSNLIEEVEIAMVDPVPNTRATAARALGALVERLGEEQFPGLIDKLISTLSDKGKVGDRLGSAQALAEILSGLGLGKLDELLPVILQGVNSSDSYTREGFSPLLLFVPVCFGSQFAPYIQKIIKPILRGLADFSDSIRETSMEAGKLIVTNYANKAVELLLPELQLGMFDENERIRLSSLQLTADLLFEVTGLSANNDLQGEDGDENIEDEDFSSKHNEISKSIINVLGQEKRDSVLSSIFVLRSDTSGLVRSAAVDVWKALVPNTPRTVKEILPVLTNIIVNNLASESSVLRTIVAQTLGDMVRRVGGDVMSRLLPTLSDNLDESTDSNSRQGVCIALYELIESCSLQLLQEYNDIIVKIIRQTLVDGNAQVREASAFAFDSFQTAVGKSAIDDIIPHLLNALGNTENPEVSDNSLKALQEIMATKSEVIFPILVPSLMEQPIDAFKANALGSLAEVAGTALYKKLSVIISSIILSLEQLFKNNDGEFDDVLSSLTRIILSVTDSEGLHPLLQQILSLVKNEEDIMQKKIILKILPNFFENTVLNYENYTDEFLQHLILSLDNDDEEIVKDSMMSLTMLVKKQDKSTLEHLVKPTKQALDLITKTPVGGLTESTKEEELVIKGFKLPKGPASILPIFLQGLMYGSNDQRQLSAIGLTSLISKTPSTNLKMYVTQIVGPLIRVVGERFNADIKAAILSALNVLFIKVPMFLRPFVPQLQRTYVRGLGDLQSLELREKAATGLGLLIQYQPKVDPLISELVNNSKNSEDTGVKTAMLQALMEVISKVGTKMSEQSKKQVINLVEDELNSVNLEHNKNLNIAYAKLIGYVSEILTVEEAKSILEDKVFKYNNIGEVNNDADESGSVYKYAENSLEFGTLTMNAFLKNSPRHIFDSEDKFVKFLCKMTQQGKYPQVCDYALSAIGKTLLLLGEMTSKFAVFTSDSNEEYTPFQLSEENKDALMNTLIKNIVVPDSNSADSKRLALIIIRTIGRTHYDVLIKPYLNLLVPQVFSQVRSSIIPIKLAAEKAYLQMFNLVKDEQQVVYNEWVSSLTTDVLENLNEAEIQVRSITEYNKRVGSRLAASERERLSSGVDMDSILSDEIEDEKEIWSIG
ncbi:related to Translational activator GCN1 [Hanseniaspora guilliermondii]|uniref:Related to Translational activator GCN1 n=1 Tax=Hanseniaspora guilliermondii TaxID=56406 RepID=A0A1L0AYJ5_9ASCO|nr:related to Translational activator GCN1 [Hanseniaspora guilliermondii]